MSEEMLGRVAMPARAAPRRAPRDRVKRNLDVLAAGALLLFLLPLLLLLTVVVAADGGSPFYGHRRIGWRGREFRCWKFRSMRTDADQVLRALLEGDEVARREWAARRKLPEDPRVTRIGRALRVTSLDELPQLWNVLRGDMSLVGPRPVTPEELREHYGQEAGSYLLVRPGITGLWQVSGRSATDYAERVRLDDLYIRTRSLGLDLAILGRTVGAVLRGRGAC